MRQTFGPGSAPSAALAGSQQWQQIVDMDRLTEALKIAINKSPASRRELCRAAGVEQSLLARVLAGERRATTTLCRRIARALRQWGTDCTAAATVLHNALVRKGD